MFYLSIIFTVVHLSTRVRITLQLIQAEGQSVEIASPPASNGAEDKEATPCTRGMNAPTNSKGQFTVTNSFYHNSFL